MWHFDIKMKESPGLILALGNLCVWLAQFHIWAFCQHLLLKLMNPWSCLFQLSGPVPPSLPIWPSLNNSGAVDQ